MGGGARGAPAAPALAEVECDQALAACDAVLIASGTATLEALLYKRPMVVAYRLAPLTFWITRSLATMF